MGGNRPGQSSLFLGQAIQVAWCGCHSGGMRQPFWPGKAGMSPDFPVLLAMAEPFGTIQLRQFSNFRLENSPGAWIILGRPRAMADTKTILLVDDDPEIVAALRTFLEGKGYRVLTAGDGNAGLAVAERENPQLVVVDMMMPKKSGFLVLEKLKSRPENKPKVIMITANEGSRHRAYAEMLGVDDYIRKPFPLDKLLERVEELLK